MTHQASSASTRTQPLRIVVSSTSFDDDDFRQFAHCLSYRDRGQPRQVRIYDFLGEQHGAITAVDLQIVLHSDSTIEIIRTRRPDCFFRESDE
ncbi:hypothetical protein AAVH_24585 [Aphelenchoides avenae]|nr:hypothetical protein AAVH_24585 [Aphelenchus avenae]